MKTVGSAHRGVNMAERVRFELTVPFGTPVFKTGALNRSAISPYSEKNDAVLRCGYSFQPAHVGAQGLRDQYRSVGLLAVFKDCHQGASNGQA